MGFSDGSVGKECVSNAGVPGLGRSPEEGNGHPLQYSCLGNPKDRGTWWAMVPRVAKSPTRLRMHTFPQEPREEGASETASQESSNNPRGVCTPSEQKWAKATFSNSKLTALALSAQRSADKCQGSTEAKRKLQNKPSTSYCLCKI